VFIGCSGNGDSLEPRTLVSIPTTPEIDLLERGMTLYDKGLFSVSREAWMELRDGYPNSYYSTLTELKIADTYFFTDSYAEALASYEEFARMRPGHEAIPYVFYQIANTHLKQYRGVKRDQSPLRDAMEAFKNLIEKHPSSLFTAFAKSKIRECHELLASYEAYVAGFYRKQGLYKASHHRYRTLSENFPYSEAKV